MDPNIKINSLIAAAEASDIQKIVSNLLTADFASITVTDSDSSLSEDKDGSSENSGDEYTLQEQTSESDDDDIIPRRDGASSILPTKTTSSVNTERGINFPDSTVPEINLTTDALSTVDTFKAYDSRPVNFLAPRTNITPSIIEAIEDDLEFYEKVSLVFLLYDSDDLALQRLKLAHRSVHSGSVTVMRLLSDWALREASSEWPDKFLEALCIIQNYDVVQNLGYDVDDVKMRFLPHNPETSLFVDCVRKVLYYVCERLSAMQLSQLSLLVHADMEQEGRIPARYDTEYMEMNILHWMSQRYLNVSAQGACGTTNLKNLTKHLKVMGELRLVEFLESISRSWNRQNSRQGGQSESECGFSDQMSVRSSISHGPSSSHSVTSQCQEAAQPVPASNTYEINPDNVGFCVIINQKNFYKEPDPVLRHLVHEDLESRIGTDVDRDRLCEAFLNFGFTVKIWENLTHTEIMQAVQESSTKLVKKEHSCFALCILSHGKKNAVYGVNSISVDVDEIEKLLHGKYCPKLMHKPKILIIQACQGFDKLNALPTDIETDGTTYTKTCPEVSDMITFWSTIPGYAAFRDRITGSWFVKSLWEVMLHKNSVEVDILNMFVKVTNKVCNKRAPINGELKAMTPQFSTSFRKTLYLPQHREARKAAARRILERYMFDYLIDQYIHQQLKQEKKKKRLKLF